MQQFVTIFVLVGESGRVLYDDSEARLSRRGLDWDRGEAIRNGQLAFWINFLDLWSMGDSFDRFLCPSSELKKADAGPHQLICGRRENIKVGNKPRNEEEVRLFAFLSQAIEAYRKATCESYLFQLRSVFDVSDGFNPDVQQDMIRNRK